MREPLAALCISLLMVGCKERDIPNPPKPLSLHTLLKPPAPFDAKAWKVETIPNYRSSELSVRASMAEDVLRRIKPGTRLIELLGLLDQPNRIETVADLKVMDKAFFGNRGYLLLSYPVIVEDQRGFHEDLQFLFDRTGVLISGRRIRVSGSIAVGP